MSWARVIQGMWKSASEEGGEWGGRGRGGPCLPLSASVFLSKRGRELASLPESYNRPPAALKEVRLLQAKGEKKANRPFFSGGRGAGGGRRGAAAPKCTCCSLFCMSGKIWPLPVKKKTTTKNCSLQVVLLHSCLAAKPHRLLSRFHPHRDASVKDEQSNCSSLTDQRRLVSKLSSPKTQRNQVLLSRCQFEPRHLNLR